jgi:hypothetical protein
MKALTVKAPQTVSIDTKELENNLHAGFKTIKKQMKRLSWLFKRNPGFIEKHLFDEHLGLEVRRLRL